jgi:hypothetical protein
MTTETDWSSDIHALDWDNAIIRVRLNTIGLLDNPYRQFRYSPLGLVETAFYYLLLEMSWGN